MSLLLITPPAEEPVSLAEMKTHLRVTGVSEDTGVSAYLSAARRAVEARGGLALISQQWRLTLDRPPQALLTLPRSPVFAVDSIAVIGRDGDVEEVDPDLYDIETGAVGRIRAAGVWPYSRKLMGGVRIDFSAGWVDAASAPEELKLAVKMLAAHFYESREAALPERLFAVPQAVDALIAPYRQVRL